MNEIKYLEAVQLLKKWAHAYYISSDAIATDDEYDTLYTEVRLFEEANPSLISDESQTQLVGGGTELNENEDEDIRLDGFEKNKHILSMYSLKDIFDKTKLFKFIDSLPDNETYVCEPKYDGASLNLLYIDGKLSKYIK